MLKALLLFGASMGGHFAFLIEFLEDGMRTHKEARLLYAELLELFKLLR